MKFVESEVEGESSGIHSLFNRWFLYAPTLKTLRDTLGAAGRVGFDPAAVGYK